MYWQSLWPEPRDWNSVAGFFVEREFFREEQRQEFPDHLHDRGDGPMPIASRATEQPSSAAAMKERRARDATQAMREREANRAAILAKTARLRAARLAKEAEAGNSAAKKTISSKKAR
jgi:hypothetical protein